MFQYTLLYIYLILYILVVLIMFWWFTDFVIAWFRKTAPEVPSDHRLRTAALDQITQYYPNAKTVLDIGCCYGGLSHLVAKRFPKMNVTGVECMPIPYAIAKLSRMIRGPKNCGFVFGDAFKFIKGGDKPGVRKFDIGLAYLLPPVMPKVEEVSNHFKVLLVMDFPLPNQKPTRVIKLHKNFMGPHTLYVYENN